MFTFNFLLLKLLKTLYKKIWLKGSKIPGERLYIGILSIKGESFEGSKFWILIIDDYILKKNSSLKVKIANLLLELKDKG